MGTMTPQPDDPAIQHLRDLVSSSLSPENPEAVRVRAGALLARLKALNRNANAATRVHKQATSDARQEMDQTHLGLQNLLYEKRHLEREIDKCRQFASMYQDITLYPLDEFKRLAPGEARMDEVLGNPHQLMLNRLSFELAERQRLDQRRKELLAQKEELLKQSKIKLVTVESVKTQIDSLVKAAADIQRKVGELVPPPPNQSRSTPGPT